MELIFAIVVGGLYAAGIYLMLQRNMVKLILGLALLSHGANLLIFTAGGLTRAHAPLIPLETHVLATASADPVPQAFILTAIVISFGVTAFMLILVHRTHQEVGSDDLDDMRTTDT
jgi:multicomponent Na+:H+ antiporter subunit C